MAGAIATGNTAYLASEFLTRRISGEAVQKANMPQSMWVEYLTGDSSLTAHFRYLNPLSASAATENTALPAVTWNPTGVLVSAGMSGLTVQYSKLLNSLDQTTLSKIADQESTALARALDISSCALFPSFTGGVVGSTGTALTTSNILAGIADLDAQFAENVGDGMYYGRLHPHAFFDLYNDIMTKNYGVAKIDVDEQGRDIIEIGQVTFMKQALVPSANSGADYVGAIYHRDALGLAIAEQPTVEVLPIPGQHSWSIDGVTAFGVGVVRPLFGVYIVSGKTA